MGEETASEAIDSRIAALGDWRGEVLARIRALIREADPEVEEAVKWRKPTNPAACPCGSMAARSARARPIETR